MTLQAISGDFAKVSYFTELKNFNLLKNSVHNCFKRVYGGVVSRAGLLGSGSGLKLTKISGLIRA